MVDDFIARKRGKAQVTYPHQALEHVLKPTYGVILYQEQVMQIAQILAGYTLGEADLLRRAMGKKKPEEMAKQRAIFTQGAKAHGVDEAIATGIFDLMEKFAGYGFNKSHSVAYALIAYQTAWLKAHYAAAFMAAVLSSDMDNSNKVIALIDECRRLKICVLPPDINTCVASFAVKDERSIRYGLGAVKGVGESAIEAITEERDKEGRFATLFDLCYRVDSKKVNRRVLEALIRAGALDSLHPSRSSMMASLAKMLRMADQDLRNRAAGQDDLFGWHKGIPQPASNGEEDMLTRVPAWSEQERLAAEKQTLGLYLSGHPIDRYEKELAGLLSTRLVNLRPGHRRVVAGLVTSLRVANTKRGRMAVAVLDDNNVRVEVVVYEEVWRTYGEYLREDRLVIVEGNCGLDEFTGSKNITADRLLDIEQARARFAKRLVVSIDSENVDAGFVEGLERILGPYRNGPCPVAIDYKQPAARARLRLGKSWRVQVPDALLERLTGSFGKDSVVLEYS
jgi:DNA polymerase-3 subunit alpha